VNNNLITSQMVEVAETFSDAYQHVIDNMVGEQRNQVVAFVGSLIYTHKPYMLVSPEGLPMAQGMVFGSEVVRDFIMTLNYVFFARWGHGENAVAGLAENLGRGLGTWAPSPNLALMPKDIHSRISESVSIEELLMSNSWLMILLMLPLFIQVEAPKPPKIVKPQLA
jgi:hypothetical protein